MKKIVSLILYTLLIVTNVSCVYATSDELYIINKLTKYDYQTSEKFTEDFAEYNMLCFSSFTNIEPPIYTYRLFRTETTIYEILAQKNTDCVIYYIGYDASTISPQKVVSHIDSYYNSKYEEDDQTVWLVNDECLITMEKNSVGNYDIGNVLFGTKDDVFYVIIFKMI